MDSLNKNSRVMIGPGVVVNPDVFLKEINDFGTDGRSFLDNNCGIIEQHHLDADSKGQFKRKNWQYWFRYWACKC